MNGRMETRSNLDKSGVDLDSVRCSLCDDGIEKEDHTYLFIARSQKNYGPDDLKCYLLWKNQMLPLLANQKLTVYIDGSLLSPSPTIVTNDVIASNPAYISWISAEQRALILIQSWLTEEAMADPGHKTARALWCPSI
ncbi:hypothetical protein Tco_0355616 [Tanacetum coccineum]